jgi:hypothetical protein
MCNYKQILQYLSNAILFWPLLNTLKNHEIMHESGGVLLKDLHHFGKDTLQNSMYLKNWRKATFLQNCFFDITDYYLKIPLEESVPCKENSSSLSNAKQTLFYNMKIPRGDTDKVSYCTYQ